MIPKIIHRVVPVNPSPIMQYCWESSKKYNVGWSHFTHYDIGDYGAYNKYLGQEVPGGVKSDLIRLYVLYEYGGVYLDADFEVYRSLGPLLNNSGFVAYESDIDINGAVLGVEPKNKTIKKALDIVVDLLESKQHNEGWLVWSEYSGKMVATGPHAITMAAKDDISFTKMPRKTFYPYIPWREDCQYSDSFRDDPEIYGIHWYLKSWGDPEERNYPQYLQDIMKLK